MIIDSHCHLVHKNYNLSLSDIYKQSQDEGITKLINIGSSISENSKCLSSCELYKDIFGAVGIYPHDNMDISFDELINGLRPYLSHEKIVGIGECGIDITNWKGGRSISDQLDLFERQVILSKDTNKPLVIHNRNGDDYILQILKKYQGEVKGVIHCFSSDWDFAKSIIDLGFYISFAGNITYPSSEQIREVVKKVPIDRFLVETDSPYLPPQGHRGEVNYPKYVKIVAEKVSQIKEKPYEDVCGFSYENTCRLFNIR